MAVYVDPPLWPAHGTRFSHLVSDTSLEELHAFAAAAGIPGRAFDGDHYDVAEARYEALVAAGAIPVEGRVLVRKLIASGLRIPARRRGKALRLPLLNRWNEVLPGHDALFLDLLDRWGEEHRKYHGRTHLLAVLEALDVLCHPADPPRAVAAGGLVPRRRLPRRRRPGRGRIGAAGRRSGSGRPASRPPRWTRWCAWCC